MKKEKDKLFWVSYADLMTSLFFVFLIVLAVVIYTYVNKDVIQLSKELEQAKKENVNLGSKNKELQEQRDNAYASLNQVKAIIDIEKQFKPLMNSDNFLYLPKSNKYVARDFLGVEIFDPNQNAIKEEYIDKTLHIGKVLANFLKKLHKTNPEFKYILVIEGNTANTYDHKFANDSNPGYVLSYGRALAVYRLWQRNNIDLRKYNTEVLICGSGFNGLDRDKNEDNNKRFTIQIIPKVQSPQNYN